MTSEEIAALRIRDLIATKESIVASMNHDLAKYGGWQCDWHGWMKETQDEIDALFASIPSRKLHSWMDFSQDDIDALTEEDWQHYERGGCLCAAQDSSECICGSWYRET